MDSLRTLADQRGYFLRREALTLGVSDKSLHRGVRTSRLVRIRQGAYCPTDIWSGLSRRRQHLARGMAAYDLSVGDVALSHTTALAAYGCPLWGASIDRVHLTYLGETTTQTEAGVVHHLRSRVSPEDFRQLAGRTVASPAWATIGALSLMQLEPAVVAGDWMLHQGLVTPEELWRLKTALNQHPKTRHLEVAIRLLDGKSESVGESRGRCLFRMMSLPRPELQWEIRDRSGRLVARCDYAWPKYNVYGEFDGAIKYGRLLREGQEPGDVVFAEKRREDAIRRITGGTVVRWTWPDLRPTSEPSLQLAALLRTAR